MSRGRSWACAAPAAVALLVVTAPGCACGPLDCAGTTTDGEADLSVTLYIDDSRGNPEPFCGPAQVTIRDGAYVETLARTTDPNTLCSHLGAVDRPGTYRACIAAVGFPPFELDQDLVVRRRGRCTMQGAHPGVILNRVDGGTPCGQAP